MRRVGELTDEVVVAGLRAGDEVVFAQLFAALNAMLLRMARNYAPSRAVAEEIVQETWLGVVTGIDRFEGRSSLRTWVVQILLNVARSRSSREARSIPFASAGPPGEEDEPLDPDRFFGPDHDLYPGHWCMGPAPWGVPEERLLAGETREAIVAAIDDLPPSQREVITLRDIGGWSTQEVCNALGVSETNARVLLHRARAKVRAAVEAMLGAVEPTT
jgi:RNA polymerase sigma-70 factor (ECF subfamily)